VTQQKTVNEGRFGQVVEDVGLSIQEFRNEGRGLDARKIELVLEHHGGDMVRALISTFPSGRIEPRFILLAADAVITNRIEMVMDEVRKVQARRRAESQDDAPLAVIGQGSSRREIRPEPADAAGGIVGRVRRLFARMFGTEAAR
jgi:hypothetical protein